jgi:hypothetical protein
MPGTLKISALVVLLFLSGCSAQRFSASEPKVLKLLPPAEGSVSVLLKQKVTFQVGERQQQFLSVARFDQQRLKLVVLLPTGQVLLSLDYDGEKLVQEILTPVDLPGREIMAIIQFAMWPEHSIKTHYSEKDGWQVETSPGKRILLTESGMVLKVTYQLDELSVDNYLKGYRIIVHTLERTEL